MKILIVNKFWYPRGGDCIVAMSTRDLLEAHGHEVRVFSMDHPDNLPRREHDVYVPTVDFSGGVKAKMSGAGRVLGLGDVARLADKMLAEFCPDVVHMHNVHSYLSPIIGEHAHRKGIRVVWTLHDYKLICPAYTCRRPGGGGECGECCEECINPATGYRGVLMHRCMKGSLAQSALAYAEAQRWNRKRLAHNTDLFISPAEFMRNKLMEGGFPHNQLTHICNMIDGKKLDLISRLGVSDDRDDFFCYVGRLSGEKGVETLLEAAVQAGVNLHIAGGGPLLDSLKKKYSAYNNIKFLGLLDAEGVTRLLLKAKASVIPSEWYEVNPLSVIESLCCGTPVIGSRIGGIPELVGDKEGVTFTPGSADELASILQDFNKLRPFRNTEIASIASTRFSADRYYSELLDAYCGDAS